MNKNAAELESKWFKKALDTWKDKKKSPKGVRYPKSVWDRAKVTLFQWATPAKIQGPEGMYYPEPWRVEIFEPVEKWGRRKFKDLWTDHYRKSRGRTQVYIGLRDNRNKEEHQARLAELFEEMKKVMPESQIKLRDGFIQATDDLERDVLK